MTVKKDIKFTGVGGSTFKKFPKVVSEDEQGAPSLMSDAFEPVAADPSTNSLGSKPLINPLAQAMASGLGFMVDI